MNAKNELAEMLQRKPDITVGFQPITMWKKIELDNFEKEALDIFQKKENQPDTPKIKNNKSRSHLISYLRYDFKKILVRTRMLYLDNNDFNLENNFYVLKNQDPIGYGYFEPLANCFICAETIGHFKNYKGNSIQLLLEDMGDGYKKYAKVMEDFFRNGLAHHFRPYAPFFIDLNTETEYKSPFILDGMLKINIPHFLDSLILALEKLISKLKDVSSEAPIESYIENLNDFENKSKYFKNTIKNL